MEEYKNIFLKKLSFVIRMVVCYGAYNIPLDWWNVAVPHKDMKAKNSRIHEIGTFFRMVRLDKMFSEEFHAILKSCNIQVIENKTGIYFKPMENTIPKIFQHPF